MTQHSTPEPTALDLAEAMAGGRVERSQAFHQALAFLAHWAADTAHTLVSGGKPQAHS